MDIEITGSYPIILDGETAGELTVSREGLFWSFEAKCEPSSEIVRLSVYGDGKEGYLGIMEPIGDMLKLNRKFSRAALKEFPSKISHAGQKGELEFIEPIVPEAKPEFIKQAVTEVKPELIKQAVMDDKPESIKQAVTEVKPIEVRPDLEPSQYEGSPPPSCDCNANTDTSAPPEDDKPPPEEPEFPPSSISELDWHPCAIPCSLFSGIKEKRVCSNITGALIALAGDLRLLAVPEEVALSLPEPNAIQFVDKIFFLDKKYLICAIKNGKSVSEF